MAFKIKYNNRLHRMKPVISKQRLLESINYEKFEAEYETFVAEIKEKTHKNKRKKKLNK